MHSIDSRGSLDAALFASSNTEPTAIMEKTTTIGNTGINNPEIEIISITLTTSNGAVTIPIATDNPLRCADAATLGDIARQMESLIRVLARGAEGRLPLEADMRIPGKYAVFVW